MEKETDRGAVVGGERNQEGIGQASPESGWGPGQNRNLGPPLTKIILVDIVLDNNIFIQFFTGEPEGNYSGEDVCPNLAQCKGPAFNE